MTENERAERDAQEGRLMGWMFILLAPLGIIGVQTTDGGSIVRSPALAAIMFVLGAFVLATSRRPRRKS